MTTSMSIQRAVLIYLKDMVLHDKIKIRGSGMLDSR